MPFDDAEPRRVLRLSGARLHAQSPVVLQRHDDLWPRSGLELRLRPELAVSRSPTASGDVSLRLHRAGHLLVSDGFRLRTRFCCFHVHVHGRKLDAHHSKHRHTGALRLLRNFRCRHLRALSWEVRVERRGPTLRPGAGAALAAAVCRLLGPSAVVRIRSRQKRVLRGVGAEAC